MIDRKRKLALVALSVVIVVGLLAMAFWPTDMHRQETRPDVQTISIDRPKTEQKKRDDAVRVLKPEQVCEQVAPKALTAYVTDSPNRPEKLGQYFAKDAEGLGIPVSDIQPQPARTFTGYLAFGRDDDTAICNVWTGLESSWRLIFDYYENGGWKIIQCEGPVSEPYHDETKTK